MNKIRVNLTYYKCKFFEKKNASRFTNCINITFFSIYSLIIRIIF